jgi:uncharacterized protein YukE
VEYAALDRAATATATVFDELTDAGETLDARATAFVGAGWVGVAAATEFRAGYDEWRAGSREVLASVVTMAGLISDANQRFLSVDGAVTDSMARVSSRFGSGGGHELGG